MSKSDRPFGILLATFLVLLFSVLSASDSNAYDQEKMVGKRVNAQIEIYSAGIVEYHEINGWCVIGYNFPITDPFGMTTIEAELLSQYLRGSDDMIGPEGVIVRKNGDLICPGGAHNIDPWIDFPAESFFDVFYELELPDVLPGDTLVNYDPLHLEAVIDQFPPFHETYVYPEGLPPVPLFNRDGIEVGAIISWEEYVSPWYEPEAHVNVETAYGSEIAVISKNGMVEVPASISSVDHLDITHVTFGYRPCGVTEPYLVFYDDVDGEGDRAATVRGKGEGDGWCGYFEPGSEPFEGQCYEFEVTFFTAGSGVYKDTCSVTLDPTPPVPWITKPDRDTLSLFTVDSFFDITYKLDDELPAPGTAFAQVLPLMQSFSRPLTPVDQLGLGTKIDSTSCGPAAGASCLEYFADNGHPELDNPEGDTSKPDQTPEDTARELQGTMGTDSKGTTGNAMISGIKSYLKGHGKSGWTVSGHDVNDVSDLGEMFRELEADGEDVIVLLGDTVTSGSDSGDTLGHWVTLGSREIEHIKPDSTVQRMDFTDPWGGGSTADNKYDIGKNSKGEPTTKGYDLDGEGADANIVGYIKVSPPEGGGGGGSIANRSIEKAPAAPWIMIDSGICTGNGVIDTLHWDTTGFAPGLYLLEVVTTDDQGYQCRDLRLCYLYDTTTDSDDEIPGARTGLIKSYPNPFNPTTNIVFSMDKEGPVTLAVYDIMGRRVRTIMDGKKMPAGPHTVTWDGKGDDGRKLSSGVYLCRFNAGEEVSSMKMILLR